ncbi:hypothetical protein E2C01_022744 [Portunus trituberculatus]|uniref:Uncharacterized protein n=1 Tax=Portunus trituberculatus TaxID=210409 RepID=A0A5B7E9N6_PORTR|nr:hypothetical protein [Portunus trituberculatus]
MRVGSIRAAMQEGEKQTVSKPAWQLCPRGWPRSPGYPLASRYPPVVSCGLSTTIGTAKETAGGFIEWAASRLGTTGLSLFQKILQLLKAPGGPLEPPDATCKDRSGVFQFSQGASWDFGESPLISRRRSRRPSFSRPPTRSSSESRPLQESSSSPRSARSLPGSPPLRRCVWADTPDSCRDGRQSPPAHFEYLDEPQQHALEASQSPSSVKSRRIPSVSSPSVCASRLDDDPQRRPAELTKHRRRVRRVRVGLRGSATPHAHSPSCRQRHVPPAYLTPVARKQELGWEEGEACLMGGRDSMWVVMVAVVVAVMGGREEAGVVDNGVVINRNE